MNITFQHIINMPGEFVVFKVTVDADDSDVVKRLDDDFVFFLNHDILCF